MFRAFTMWYASSKVEAGTENWKKLDIGLLGQRWPSRGNGLGGILQRPQVDKTEEGQIWVVQYTAYYRVVNV